LWQVDGPIGKVGSARYGIVAGGRPALTEFRLVAASAECTLVEARPLTGRTHQIRVHLESCGLPIVGDGTYGGAPAGRMMLHCAELAFNDEKGRELRIVAPPDGAFATFMAEQGLVIPSSHGSAGRAGR
jgi:23S rRNA-/tRNA-specific pseudouridylate synthase